jgi:hypothetical protein
MSLTLPLPWSVPRLEQRLRVGLVASIVVLAVAHGVVLAYHLAVSLWFPYDLNYGEGYVLNDALRLSRGETIYVDLQQFPMVRSPYPPLFPWLWSLAIGVAGASFWVGRLLSIAALAGLLAVLAWSARRVGAGPWPVVVAPALLAASPFVYQWAGYARVDLLALLFAAAGVCVAHWVPGWRGLLGAAALCSLALWTKQTTLTAALAIAIACGLRNWRHATVFAAAIAVPNGILAYGLNIATAGEFQRHVLEGNASNPLLLPRALYFVGGFLALHLPALAAASWWLSRASRGVPSPVAVYLVLALLAMFSSASGGSSVNYLLEPLVAVGLAAPFAWRAAAAAPLVGPLLAATQLALLLHWPNGFGTTYLAESALGRTPSGVDVAVGAQLDNVMRQSTGEVIAEPAGFALRNGRPVYLQPLDLRAEEQRGRWRGEPLAQALSSGRYERVITAWEFLPSAAERAVREHFELESTLASPDGLTFRVYRYTR